MQSMLVLVKESDSEGMAKILGSGQTKSVKLDQLLSTGARVVSSWVALGGLCLLVEGVFEVVERECSPSHVSEL